MNSQKTVVPEPSFKLVQREDEGAKVYAAVNTTLATLVEKDKQLYGWQLSLIMDLNTEDEYGMTLSYEVKEIEPFCIQLDKDLCANGNAVPLARITWRKTRELLYRVYNPTITNDHITGLIEAETNPRPFTYTIDPDDNWKMAQVYLKQFTV